LTNLTPLAYYLPDIAGTPLFARETFSAVDDALDPLTGGLVMTAWTLGCLAWPPSPSLAATHELHPRPHDLRRADQAARAAGHLRLRDRDRGRRCRPRGRPCRIGPGSGGRRADPRPRHPVRAGRSHPDRRAQRCPR